MNERDGTRRNTSVARGKRARISASPDPIVATDPADRYRAIVESAIDFAIIATDRDGKVTDWNAGAERVLGWSANEIRGDTVARIFTPEDREAGRVATEMVDALSRDWASDERWHLKKDGTRFWASGEMMPLRGGDGAHLGFVKILRDRTQQHLAGRALAEAAERHAGLAATQRAVDAADGDLDAVMNAVVGGALAVMPTADGAVIEMREGGEIVYRAAAGTSSAHVGLRLKVSGSFSGRSMIEGRPLLCEDTGSDARVDGDACRRVGVGSMIAVPVPHHGEFVGVLNLHASEPRRLTERDVPTVQLLVGALSAGLAGRAEAEAVRRLRESEERLRIAQEAGGIGTFEWDLTTGIVTMSPTFRALWGLDVPALPLQALGELVLPEDRRRIGSLQGRVGDDALAYTEYRIRRPDTGQVRWIARRGEVVENAEGRPTRGFGVAYDITGQKAREGALADLNASLEERVAERTAERNRVWEISRDLLAVMGFDGHLKAINPAWEATLGLDAATLLARPFPEQVHPDDHEAVRVAVERLRRGEPIAGFEDRLRHADGSWRWINWSLVPEEDVFYAVGRDVTDEKLAREALARTEDALRQSQKMEAVGQLTGGIAHDFNNLLGGISGALDLLTTRLGQGRLGDAERYVAVAQGAVKRAAALTHRLLAFSRRQMLDPKPTDANRLVAEMEDLVRRTVGPAITVDVSAAEDLWPTLVDPNQLENALLNLCINARDAMPDGGTLTVATTNVEMDAAAAAEHDLPPGDYVSLCVTDTGTGMPPEVAVRAFDPFFTTKSFGQGTGLGLSMIYGFARQSGGQARIASVVGQGTSVHLYMPRHDVAQETEPGTARVAVPRALAGETVLVVDDEATLRAMTGEALGELGYTVIEVADGPAGLQVLQSDARIDLLLTDVGLPGRLNGRQVAETARATRPSLKVLFVTGFAEEAVIGVGHLEPGMDVLTKPFAMETLAARIRALIGPGEERGR